MTLVNSPEVSERIKEIENVSHEDNVKVNKKIKMHTMFILEASDEKDNNKEN